MGRRGGKGGGKRGVFQAKLQALVCDRVLREREGGGGVGTGRERATERQREGVGTGRGGGGGGGREREREREDTNLSSDWLVHKFGPDATQTLNNSQPLNTANNTWITMATGTVRAIRPC